MTLTVAPTVARGSAPLIQPFYYTSSLFVEPMKEDMSKLLSAFVDAYSGEPLEPPASSFQLFKNAWHNEGWDLIHMTVLDARAREVFLRTVIRLFVDRLGPTEPPLIRIGALFGLYTFFSIQRGLSKHRLYSVDYIILEIDVYEQLLKLPDALPPPLRYYATYIISQFLALKAFHILPHSSLGAQNPRNLPHSYPILTRDIDYGHKKKTGRPSHFAQRRKADEALSALEMFVERAEGPHGESSSAASSSPLLERPAPVDYVGLKEQLRAVVPSDTIKAAEARTMERIRDAEKHVVDSDLPVGDREGVERLISASAREGGLLELVQCDW